ncbi:MAG: hypothetical protein PUG10_02835 [Lachnospiraceae bacterium]|nr:hypothetical protein [Lachnospiraceae bacterium]
MGCFFVLLALIAVPIFLGFLIVVLGALGSLFAAIISTVLFVLLRKNGIFDKYCNSTIAWQRIVASMAEVIIILIMIGSYLMSAVSGAFLIMVLLSK